MRRGITAAATISLGVHLGLWLASRPPHSRRIEPRSEPRYVELAVWAPDGPVRSDRMPESPSREASTAPEPRIERRGKTSASFGAGQSNGARSPATARQHVAGEGSERAEVMPHDVAGVERPGVAAEHATLTVVHGRSNAADGVASSPRAVPNVTTAPTDEAAPACDDRPSVLCDGGIGGLRSLLDPAAVARSAVAVDDLDGSESTRRGVQAALTQAARDVPHRSRRPPPSLVRQADGTYLFRGPRFDASVRPDGSVEFADRNAELGFVGIFPVIVFDVTELLMRAADQDPLVAERLWFMRETEVIRDAMAARARARELRRGELALERSLDAIWSDPSLPARTRRRRVFAMWDDCADDDIGRRGRAVVIAFIRRAIPHGGRDAYPEAEIAELNSMRSSRERFVPYG